MNIYKKHGFSHRADYLVAMGRKYHVPMTIVRPLADLLGPSEDFDALVTELADYGSQLPHYFIMDVVSRHSRQQSDDSILTGVIKNDYSTNMHPCNRCADYDEGACESADPDCQVYKQWLKNKGAQNGR